MEYVHRKGIVSILNCEIYIRSDKRVCSLDVDRSSPAQSHVENCCFLQDDRFVQWAISWNCDPNCLPTWPQNESESFATVPGTYEGVVRVEEFFGMLCCPGGHHIVCEVMHRPSSYTRLVSLLRWASPFLLICSCFVHNLVLEYRVVGSVILGTSTQRVINETAGRQWNGWRKLGLRLTSNHWIDYQSTRTHFLQTETTTTYVEY